MEDKILMSGKVNFKYMLMPGIFGLFMLSALGTYFLFVSSYLYTINKRNFIVLGDLFILAGIILFIVHIILERKSKLAYKITENGVFVPRGWQGGYDAEIKFSDLSKVEIKRNLFHQIFDCGSVLLYSQKVGIGDLARVGFHGDLACTGHYVVKIRAINEYQKVYDLLREKIRQNSN